MKTDSFVACNLFHEKLIDLVSDYIENSDVYPEESCIAIQKKSLDIELLIHEEAHSNWETYPISLFMRLNEYKRGKEVDIDATLDIADRYYFLR